MKAARHRVFVVDDDPSMRAALKNLLRSVGLEARLFPSAQKFLEGFRTDGPSCLLLDVRLPGLSGLDLQRQLAIANIHIPMVFITAHGDIAMSVRAMKEGAVDFLTKPFRDQDVLDAIQIALTRDRVHREEQKELAELHQRYNSLTPRERELLPLTVSGRSNKEIAAVVGMNESTVKAHRRNMMQKMKTDSFADLIRLAYALQVVIRQNDNRTQAVDFSMR
jgi:RNA polymerase sigma factor (sigma-70 family)